MKPRGPTTCRGIRGATTVDSADDATVAAATRELLDEIEVANGCRPEDVAAVVFTLTADLAGANPAEAARGVGWAEVPLLCVAEHPTGGAAPDLCLRVLLLWNTDRPQSEIRHVYLRGARALRPDLVADAKGGSLPW
jgi:chorismate mutase